ncbi:cache domain-containing protein [Massilia glaciei]|uniref:histidine kinase n=1 Tax=Massilia glaciei TaxID=1524097 RepID=A0A2U2HLS5_9BURK|nr:cache domain-containing protein [Massilia glaciei]PWF48457.1 histidine kinase [Massilia glaciei]
MKLRHKVVFLAITPLIVVLCALALFVRHQAVTLAQQQRDTIEQAYLASKEAELKHYVALAMQSVGRLCRSGRSDPATLAEARRILSTLSYGDDGYFFVYDLQGVNLVHPRQPELVGRKLWELRTGGEPVVQRLVERARAGGGFHRYAWAKPSSRTAAMTARKLGYVLPMPRWGWVLGTGIYLDDVDAALTRIDARQSRNIEGTMAWIAGLAILSALLVELCGLALNLSELRVADAKLRSLARRVVGSQEAERARLSRDLHDGISQCLVSIKLQLEAGLVRLAGDAAEREAARAGFGRTAGQLAEVLAEVRRISHDLRPAILDDLGLAAALAHLAQESTAAWALPFRFSSEGGMAGLDQEVNTEVVSTALFRIAQEALTNVERHAGARRVELTLVRTRRRLTLTVADDGCGFDPAGVALHPGRGIGLRNMMERMDAIGGELAVASSPAGTSVRAAVALCP